MTTPPSASRRRRLRARPHLGGSRVRHGANFEGARSQPFPYETG